MKVCLPWQKFSKELENEDDMLIVKSLTNGVSDSILKENIEHNSVAFDFEIDAVYHYIA